MRTLFFSIKAQGAEIENNKKKSHLRLLSLMWMFNNSLPCHRCPTILTSLGPNGEDYWLPAAALGARLEKA
jgi:hypothetical protein